MAARDSRFQRHASFLQVVRHESRAGTWGAADALLEVIAACRNGACCAAERIEALERSDRLDRCRQAGWRGAPGAIGYTR